MKNIKIIIGKNPEIFEKKVGEFILACEKEKLEIVDIKFSIDSNSGLFPVYTAMVIFEQIEKVL